MWKGGLTVEALPGVSKINLLEEIEGYLWIPDETDENSTYGVTYHHRAGSLFGFLLFI